MSILPQAPEEAGVAECIVLTEAVAQGEIDPAGPENPQSTVPLATQARPVVVTVVAHTLATAVSGTSLDSQRPPVQGGVGIPIGNRANRGSSSRAPTRTPRARAGGPTNLDEFINGPEYGPECVEGSYSTMRVDVLQEEQRQIKN